MKMKKLLITENVFKKGMCLILSAGFLFISCNSEINTSAQNVHVWDGTYDTSWYSSYEKEFHISTPEQLAGIAEIVNSGNDMSGKTIYLDEDIYLNDISEYENWENNFPENSWKIIGTSDKNYFNGTFSGCGNTVYGLYINSPDYEYTGFFGYCGSSSCIENITSEKAYIQSSYADTGYTGGIAALTYGTIENCENNGKIYVQAGYSFADKNISINTGGIAGYSRGKTENCRNKGEILAFESIDSSLSYFYTGGIAGSSSDEIKNCVNYSDVLSMGNCSYAGGICGLSNKKISSCVNNGKMGSYAKKTEKTSEKDDIKAYSGGIAGSSSENIENSVNNGEIYAQMNENCSFYLLSGGIAGYTLGNVQLCTNNADIYADDGENSYSGGISGKFDGKAKTSSINKSFNTGNVSGGKYIGGIAGFSTGGVNICSNKGSISTKYEDSFAGGITGTFSSSSSKNSYVENVYNRGEISGGVAGGIVGYNIGNISLLNIYNTGKVYGNAEKSDILSRNGEDAVLNAENVYCLEKNNTDSDKITALSENEMKTRDFADILGEYFSYVENDYPKLEYENDISYISLKTGEKINLTEKFPQYSFETAKNDVLSIENGILSGISEGYSVISAKDVENNLFYVRIEVKKAEIPETTENTTETTEITETAVSSTVLSTTSEVSSTTAKTIEITETTKVSASTTAKTTSIISENDNLGDVTNDGKVDSKDAVLILKKYAQSIVTGKITGMSYSRGDVNKDGRIDSKDAVFILRYYAAKLAGSFRGKLAEFVLKNS